MPTRRGREEEGKRVWPSFSPLYCLSHQNKSSQNRSLNRAHLACPWILCVHLLVVFHCYLHNVCFKMANLSLSLSTSFPSFLSSLCRLWLRVGTLSSHHFTLWTCFPILFVYLLCEHFSNFLLFHQKPTLTFISLCMSFAAQSSSTLGHTRKASINFRNKSTNTHTHTHVS